MIVMDGSSKLDVVTSKGVISTNRGVDGSDAEALALVALRGTTGPASTGTTTTVATATRRRPEFAASC